MDVDQRILRAVDAAVPRGTGGVGLRRDALHHPGRVFGASYRGRPQLCPRLSLDLGLSGLVRHPLRAHDRRSLGAGAALRPLHPGQVGQLSPFWEGGGGGGTLFTVGAHFVSRNGAS